MKRFIYTLLLCGITQAAFAQSKNYYFILKTHPLGNLLSPNIGLEIGKENISGHLTLAIFRQHSFPYETFYEMLQSHESGRYQTKGMTYRLGYKILMSETNRKYIYLEPQIRYGTTAGKLDYYGHSIGVEYYKTNTESKQGLVLLGVQWRNKPQKLMLDVYLGMGYFKTQITNVLESTTTQPIYNPIGTTWAEEGENISFYLGTSLGFIFKKKSKIGQ